MVKICLQCESTWAGGIVCEDCGGVLTDPFDTGAQWFPKHIWAYIRLQYGARRGMLLRVIALFMGPVVGGWFIRESLVSFSGVSLGLALSGSVGLGVLIWFCIHWIAGRAVRIWVLRRGQLNKKKFMIAMIKRIKQK